MKKNLKIIYMFLLSILIGTLPLKVEASGITLHKSSLNLGIGYSETLKYTLPDGVNNSSVIWRSTNPEVATVVGGKVTGVSEGTAIITAMVGSKSATCKVTVSNNYVSVTGITLNKSSLSLLVGTSETLIKSVKPTNATNQDVTWSSTDQSVATVDADGKVTAKKVGSTVITAYAQGYSATCKITVIDTVALKSISMTKSNVTIKEKATEQLTINFSPSNATNKKVTWKSSNTNIVTVDKNGKITGISKGTATITAISNEGGYVAQSNITVEEISKKVTSVTIDQKELKMLVGSEKTLTATIYPNYAENKKITWLSSDNKIATVEDGLVKAIKPGTVEIKVVTEDGNKEAICKITITSPPVTKIYFKETNKKIYLDSEVTLDFETEPTNSVLEEQIWSSSDEKIATVENGVVKALAIGTTTITVSDKDNKITASIEITVIAKPKEKLNITIDGYDLKFDPQVKNYNLDIKDEKSLKIKTNINEDNVIIHGNTNLKNGSIITITIKEDEKVTYIINIKKKGNYTLYFIAAISLLLFINLIRYLIKNKKKK